MLSHQTKEWNRLSGKDLTVSMGHINRALAVYSLASVYKVRVVLVS